MKAGDVPLQYSHSYLVPDYYEAFFCKGPDCRSTCCKNWTITLTLDEYLSLLGIDCSADLRSRLDRAMHLSDSPTVERYAAFSPNWEGDCPLHRADGWCALQKECGEGVLSSVCRYYPRSPRAAYGFACSCSCSCEKTLELLFAHEKPLTFHEVTLTFELAAEEAALSSSDGYAPVMRAIAFLQDRTKPLPERLAAMQTMFGTPTGSLNAQEDLLPVIRYLLLLLDRTARRSINLQVFLPTVLAGLGLADTASFDSVTEQTANCLRAAAARIAEVLPDWEIRFENMLVNHVFYSAFPYREGSAEQMSDPTPLYTVYALLRFLSAGFLSGGGLPEGLTDLYAAAFRLIDHTAFSHNAAFVLRSTELADPTQHLRLLTI